jgi:hypothetical protein
VTLIARSRWKKVLLDGQTAIRIQCSSCRVVGRLHLGAADSLGYQVNAAGQVIPSVVCGNNDCDFHDHVTLEGWPGNV